MNYRYKKTLLRIIYQRFSSILDEIAHLPYAILKGESLSLQAYGELGLRHIGDIDILVDRNYLRIFEMKLSENGFAAQNISRADRIMMLSSSHQVIPWSKEVYPHVDIIIDLNFDIFWGEYSGKRINIDEFLSDINYVDIYGIQVKILPPLKSMIQLILHHYKEMNSIYHLAGHDSINYTMFKDVYYLWKNNQEAISLNKLYAISSKYEIIPFVFYILYFTNIIFADSDLNKYVEVFKTAEGIELLDWYGLANNERKLWKIDFKKRLETDNLYEIIKDDLTEADIEKLERNRRIFG